MFCRREMLRGVISVVCLLVLGAAASSAFAAISASEGGGPAMAIEYLGNKDSGFNIFEDVALDPAAGPWIKQLKNNGPGPISSGQQVPIFEELKNTGSIPWTDWHEQIITFNGPPIDEPGFLFKRMGGKPMLLLKLDGNTLTEGADYTVVDTPATVGGDTGSVAIDIFFEPGAIVGPGQTLRIEKYIFEVHGDSNVWLPGESVEVLEYPTPEPSTIVLGGLLALAGLGRRNRR